MALFGPRRKFTERINEPIHRRLLTMSFSLRRPLQLTSLALGLILVLAVTPIAAQASVSNPTTKSVLDAAQKTMAKESGVHIYVTSKTGTVKSVVVVDIGATYGQETITSGKNSVRIIVTPSDAYLSGSATGLTKIMGLTAVQQKKVGNLFVVMKAGTTPYTSFHSNLTTTVLSGILPHAKGTKYKVSGDRAKDYQLSWKTAASGTGSATKSVLTISSGSKTLPIKEVITGTTGGGTTNFSMWGENVVEQAPAAANTIPYAKVIG
jgi:hypothetical protein